MEVDENLQNLKDQLLAVCEKLAHTGQECLFMSVNILTDDTYCCGSQIGEDFLMKSSSIVDLFIQFCRAKSAEMSKSKYHMTEPDIICISDDEDDVKIEPNDISSQNIENDVRKSNSLPNDRNLWSDLYQGKENNIDVNRKTDQISSETKQLIFGQTQKQQPEQQKQHDDGLQKQQHNQQCFQQHDHQTHQQQKQQRDHQTHQQQKQQHGHQTHQQQKQQHGYQTHQQQKQQHGQKQQNHCQQKECHSQQQKQQHDHDHNHQQFNHLKRQHLEQEKQQHEHEHDHSQQYDHHHNQQHDHYQKQNQQKNQQNQQLNFHHQQQNQQRGNSSASPKRQDDFSSLSPNKQIDKRNVLHHSENNGVHSTTQYDIGDTGSNKELSAGSSKQPYIDKEDYSISSTTTFTNHEFETRDSELLGASSHKLVTSTDVASNGNNSKRTYSEKNDVESSFLSLNGDKSVKSTISEKSNKFRKNQTKEGNWQIFEDKHTKIELSKGDYLQAFEDKHPRMNFSKGGDLQVCDACGECFFSVNASHHGKTTTPASIITESEETKYTCKCPTCNRIFHSDILHTKHQLKHKNTNSRHMSQKQMTGDKAVSDQRGETKSEFNEKNMKKGECLSNGIKSINCSSNLTTKQTTGDENVSNGNHRKSTKSNTTHLVEKRDCQDIEIRNLNNGLLSQQMSDNKNVADDVQNDCEEKGPVLSGADDNDYKCKYCHKRFSTKNYNIMHELKFCKVRKERYGIKDQMFQCNICWKMLKTKSYMTHHKMFVCSGKTMKKNTLSSKQKKKKFKLKCRVCSKLFRYEHTLKIHMSILHADVETKLLSDHKTINTTEILSDCKTDEKTKTIPDCKGDNEIRQDHLTGNKTEKSSDYKADNKMNNTLDCKAGNKTNITPVKRTKITPVERTKTTPDGRAVQNPCNKSQLKTNICPLCFKPFTYKHNLIRHMKTLHNSHGYRRTSDEVDCLERSNKNPDKSTKVFGSDKDEFCQQKREENVPNIHGGTTKYKCFVCDLRFRSDEHLKYHARRHIGESHSICGYCGKDVFGKSSMRHHFKSHSETTKYCRGFSSVFNCHLCDKTFSGLGYLKQHLGYIHKQNRNRKLLFECRVCRRQCMSSYHLNLHMRRHGLSNWGSISLDDQKHVISDHHTSSKSSEQHLLNQVNGDVVGSPTVDQTQNKSSLSEYETLDQSVLRKSKPEDYGVHYQPESRSNRVQCKFCRTCFARKWNLKRHLENVFCQYKKTQVGKKSWLRGKDILKKNHFKKQIKSNQQQKSALTTKMSNLGKKILKQNHNFKYNNVEKPPNKKNFSSSQLSQKHVENSSNSDLMEEKVYYCGICTKSFHSMGVLKWHRAIHFKEVTYECDICHIKVFNAISLKIHKKLHNQTF